MIALLTCAHFGSRDSVIAMGWVVRGSSKRCSFLQNRPDGLWVPIQHPPSQCAARNCFGGKRSGHEVDHPPPSTAQVKNEWRNTSGLLIGLHDAWGGYWDYRTFSAISETTWLADMRTEGIRSMFAAVIRAELVPELSKWPLVHSSTFWIYVKWRYSRLYSKVHYSMSGI